MLTIRITGDNLQTARRLLGWSLQETASRSGVNWLTLRKYEAAGERRECSSARPCAHRTQRQGADIISRIPENVPTIESSLVNIRGNAKPPRDPNDDEDDVEDENDEDGERDDDREPPVVREPDE